MQHASALLAGVAKRGFGTFSAALDAIDRSGRMPTDKVKAALEAFIAYGEMHPARYRLLLSDPDIASRGGRLEAVAMRTFAAFETRRTGAGGGAAPGVADGDADGAGLRDRPIRRQ